MSRSSTAAAPDPSAVDASLHLLVHQLADDLATGSMSPSLLHVSLGPDGLQLAMFDLEGSHPSEFLLGFVAPDEWYALGSATAGNAYDAADRSTLAPARHRVHTATLLSRSGELAHRTVVHGEPELTERLAGEAVVGEQIDLLRLALGLPTDPPPCSTAVYWAIGWLSSIMGGPPPSTWEDVVRAHPASPVRQSADEDPAIVFERAERYVESCTWRRLRRLVASDRVSIPSMTADDARWLDEGAFARMVLSRCPPLSLLRRRVAERLSRDLHRQLTDALDRLGVPETSWPERAT